jgi:glutamyl-tRNA reductase
LRLHCLGISHRTATSELRERVGFSSDDLSAALAAARRDQRIERLVIVSTCHRTELYAEAPGETVDVGATLLEWWAGRVGIEQAELMPHTYALHGVDALRHLFRVAAALDSVVLGEAQIVAQVAGALRSSVAAHAASPLLKLAFKSAVRSGEHARTSVWGRLEAASLGSAAIDAAAASTHGLDGRSVVVVGAGEIAELALRSLAPHNPARITIANRTVDTALELGAHHGADACPLNALPSLLRDTDVVITATRATNVVLDVPTIASIMKDRSTRTLTLIDVSLPRNIDIEARTVPGVELIGIDDLGPYVSEAHAERRAVVPTVARIVERELGLLRTELTKRVRITPNATAAAAAGIAATLIV